MNLLNIFKNKKSIAKLYTKCNQLPIHNFNECIANDNFNYLKRNLDDDVSRSLLESTWLDIMDEYFTLTNNRKALYQLKNKIAIMILEKKVSVLELLQYCVVKEINVDEELKSYRMTRENLSQHLGLAKNDLLKKIAALPEEMKTNNNEFDKTIAVLLSRGFSINRFKTVVSEWVAMLEIVELQNKANQE